MSSLKSQENQYDEKNVLSQDYFDETTIATQNYTLNTEEALDITVNDIRGIVEDNYDSDGSANTLRMWTLSLILSSIISAVDTFFSFRFPTINIGPIVSQLLAYPLGRLWHIVIPEWEIKLWNWSIELNPGPFNIREHTLVYVFTNIVVHTGLLRNVQIEQTKFFDMNIGTGRYILFNVCGYLISWGIAGLALPVLVYPAQAVWPSVLSSCALLKTLHSYENPSVPHWKISRLSFFLWCFLGSFVWYWFSDLIIPFIANLGAFPSWIKPDDAVLGQVFGVKNGLGLLPLTFDWTQISTISNPLLTPVWASLTIFGSFVFWIYIVVPGLYYRNHWETAHFPLLSNKLFNKHGKKYDVSKVINKTWELDFNKYKEYSPIFLPIGFIINLALGLGGFSAMMVMFLWKFKKDVWDHMNKQTDEDVKQSPYMGISPYYYIGSIICGISLGFLFVEGWNHELQLRAGGYIVSLIIGIIMYLPVGLIESRTSFSLNMSMLFNVIGAFWLKGQPIATLYFLSFGFSSLQHAMHYTQGAKLGHYMKTPSRLTSIVLFAGGIWSSFVTAFVTGFIIHYFPNICSENAENLMICKKQRTAFNTQIIWGLFGSHLFGANGRYSFILWFFLVGAGISLFIILMQYLKPKSKFWEKLNPALIMAGADYIPTATGINYTSWFSVAFSLNYLVHKYYPAWWKKYNMVLASALDCGVAIAAILIYVCITYTGAGNKYTWWGTTVSSSSCDAKGCPYLPSSGLNGFESLW